MDDLSGCLARQWIHSWEEDSGAVRAYRPEGSSLPLSRRPRQIIELSGDGRFVSRSAGPADARVSREGRWDLSEEGTLTVRWDGGEEQVSLQVLECGDDVLKLQALSGSIE